MCELLWSGNSVAIFEAWIMSVLDIPAILRRHELYLSGRGGGARLNLKSADIEHDGPSLMLIHAAPLLHYIGVKIGA